ncbi:hypothetical protein HDU97_006869 [Phlyctochytrium planicorne]|nr:hypothetical protein HDU97_006869 [Phlyctochytrium planicorne]
MVILVSFGIGAIIQSLISMNIEPKDYLYCSKKVALDMYFYPIQNENSDSIPTTPAGSIPGTTNEVAHVNFLRVSNPSGGLSSSSSLLDAASLTSSRPCLIHLGKRIDKTVRLPYYTNPEATNNLATYDATFLPQPFRGWISITVLQELTKEYMLNQKKEWYIVGAGPGVDPVDLVGISALTDATGMMDPAANANGVNPLTNLTDYSMPVWRGLERTPNDIDISKSALTLFSYKLPRLGYLPVSQILRNPETNQVLMAVADGMGFPGAAAAVEDPFAGDPASSSSGSNFDDRKVTGLLNAFEKRIFLDIDLEEGVVSSFSPVPYFKLAGTTPEEMDTIIYTSINTSLTRISKLDKHVLFSLSPSTIDIAKYLSNVSHALTDLPYGAILFTNISHPTLTYSYTLHAGRDKRIEGSSAFPSQGLRQVLAVAQIGQALLRSGRPAMLGSATITQSLRAFPEVRKGDVSVGYGGYIGRWVYPFGVSFLVPIFVVTLVAEKEARISIMLKLNGVSPWIYNLSNYITFYILFAMSTALFIITGYLTKLQLFTLVNHLRNIQTTYTSLQKDVPSSPHHDVLSMGPCPNRRLLCILGHLQTDKVGASVIISIGLEQINGEQARDPTVLFIWPPFAFYRGLYLLNVNSYRLDYRAYTWSRFLQPEDEVRSCAIALLIATPSYLILGGYLSSILSSGPDGAGAPLPWHWPITLPIIKTLMHLHTPKLPDPTPTAIESGAASSAAVTTTLSSGTPKTPPPFRWGSFQIEGEADAIDAGDKEDADVRAERDRVTTNRYPSDAPLVIHGMRKVYRSNGFAVVSSLFKRKKKKDGGDEDGVYGSTKPKVAVKNVSLAVERGVVFGLLGPNGAGKTTLLSILTGISSPSAGTARLAGYDLHTEKEMVHRSIGVCPQYDILWDDLTVKEHLLFYARLKGIPPKLEENSVLEAMKSVNLETFAHRLSKGLSGGEKRRLSIAIALVGSPGVVFLDEPTTGLDPEVRRVIWNIISKARKEKTIILTTHSMEEAEVCCQRIGIMAKGTLRCLGPQLRLKQLYGTGFKLQFATDAPRFDAASKFVEGVLERHASSFSTLDRFSATASYEFRPKTPGDIAELYEKIEAGKDEAGICDWGLSQTTLDEVFLRLISEEDAQAD